ncbi:MAG: DUF4956 domain-containing protein [Bacilli bacterium]|nr:DUF4956 domain-containing protein [Bacilli bacterium]
MFDSLFSSGITTPLVLLTIGVSLLCGFISSFLFSLKLKSSKGFFITMCLMPVIVTISFVFLNIMITNDTTSIISKIAVVMVGLGLVRFRSVPGRSEEMLALFESVVIGAVAGLGYWLFTFIIAIAIPLVFVLLSHINIFTNKKMLQEKLLKITIPESLEYSNVFTDVFNHYLKEVEMVGVKTTGMGSMFRLSYRVIFKNVEEEKEFIDELRTKNGNLEISVLPFLSESKDL